MNISNIGNSPVYLNNNTGININNRELNQNNSDNILKMDNVYNKTAENNITEDYIEKISSLSKGNIKDINAFNEGLVNMIGDSATQFNNGLTIFKSNKTVDFLTVGDMASYFYNQNKVSSSLNYAEKIMNQGMNKNSAVYKNNKDLFDAVSNDQTGLAKYIAELYFMVTAPEKYNNFSKNLDKYENTKLKDLSSDSLHNLMIAKETGDIEIFNHVLDNLKLKENNLIDIKSLQKSYTALQKDIKDKPAVDEQQTILEKAREKAKEKYLK